MSTKRMIVNIALSAELHNALERFCRESNRSKTQVVRDLIFERLIQPAQERESAKEIVLATLKQQARYMRAGKLQVLLAGSVSRTAMFRALNALVEAGDVEK